MRILFLILLSFFIFKNGITQEKNIGKPWNIPIEYKNKKNPTKSDSNLEKLGKAAWAKHCRSCHGNLGLGDGPKSASLSTFPGNFKDSKFQSRTDGEIYYQSFVGREEMPNFEKKIVDEEERWAIINLIRTMK